MTLERQDLYDELVETLKSACPPACCKECAFDIPGTENCSLDAVMVLFVAMRGNKGGRA